MHKCLAVVLASGMAALALGQPQEKIELRTVKYDALCDAINGLKGKVVVVDVWASWCHPCKAAFPNLVKLHEKYAKEGLIAVSISLDSSSDKEEDRRWKQDAMKFLQDKGARFTNFLLDEEQEVWQKKFHVNGPPVVFVFNREGKWTQFREDKANPEIYPEVEKLVIELLRSK
jgi:thiol-disulfide isomerase/thioredoxin